MTVQKGGTLSATWLEGCGKNYTRQEVVQTVLVGSGDIDR